QASSSPRAISPSLLPARRNSSLSLVPASARDSDSAPYISAINPSAFSRLSAPASIISASELTMPDNSSSSALLYGSPCLAISGAVLGSRQPVSLLSRCLRERYSLITLNIRERGVSPLADFKRWSQFVLAEFRRISTKRSSFES